MDGILIGTALLIVIMIIRRHGQDSDVEVFAPVRLDADSDSTTGSVFGSSFLRHETTFLSSDDGWSSSSEPDGSPMPIGYESDTSTDTSRWTDPMYAYELDNIYHGTLIDPTHHDDSFSSSSDDNWLSSTTSFDDSFSSSSFDDSCSSSSFDDSFSSSSFSD